MNNAVALTLMGGQLIAEIGCDLDHHGASGVREQVDRRIFEEQPQVLVLDFCSVGFMDSSGIAFIIGRAELMRSTGGKTVLRGLSPGQHKLIRLSGIDRMQGLTVDKTTDGK